MAIVLQDEHIFNDTIAENIRAWRPDASDAAVMAAAKVARCHDFIGQFPQGYATRTGSEGQALSGGERQRIAIARAILKNAPIIVLDEASAAIDPINAAAISGHSSGYRRAVARQDLDCHCPSSQRDCAGRADYRAQ